LLKKTLRLLAQLAIAVAALAGMVVVAQPAEAAAVSWQTLQSDIVYWTNHQRTRNGCAALKVDNRLVRAARDHSAWMARTRTFSHVGSGGSTFVTRVEATGYTAPLGENIANGYRTAIDVMNAWMKSPGHRANILNCRAKSIGVGAVYASNGNPYYTQEFGWR
jgi:uncharacterized protein YkwD